MTVVGFIIAWVIIAWIIGMWAWRRHPPKTAADYILAGRKLGIPVSFFTTGATQWSALSFMGFLAIFFLDGISGLMAIWGMYILLTGILYIVLGPRIKKVGNYFGHVTMCEMFNNYYSSRILGVVTGALLILAVIPYLQIQLGACAYIFDVASGGRIPFIVGAMFLYFIIITYVVAGGLRSVAWADTVMGALFIGFSFFLGIALVSEAGGLGIFSSLASSRPELFSLPGGRGIFNNLYLWSWAIPVGFGWLFHPHMWYRVQAVKTMKFLYIWPALMAIGWIGVILIQGYGAASAGQILMPGFAPADKLLVTGVLTYLPLWVFAIVCAGAVSAMATSLNSQAHGIASTFSYDIIRTWKRGMKEKTVLLAARISIPVFMLFGLLLWYVYPQLLVDLGALSASLGAICIFGVVPCLFGIRFVTKYGVWASLVGGALTMGFTHFVVKFPLGIFSGMWGMIVGFILIIVVSFLTKEYRVESTTCDEYKKALASKVA